MTNTNIFITFFIQLEEPIKFNKEQQPIALAKPYDIPKEGQLMRISGFGKIGVSSYPSKRKVFFF